MASGSCSPGGGFRGSLGSCFLHFPGQNLLSAAASPSPLILSHHCSALCSFTSSWSHSLFPEGIMHVSILGNSAFWGYPSRKHVALEKGSQSPWIKLLCLSHPGESLVPEPEDQVEEAEHGAEGGKAVAVRGDPACQRRLHGQQGARGGHRGRGALNSQGDWAGF